MKLKDKLFEEHINSVLAEGSAIKKDVFVSEKETFALVIATTSPDPIYEVKRCLFFLFFKDVKKSRGVLLYDPAYEGEDFYYAEKVLVKISSVKEEKDGTAVILVEKADGKTQKFNLKNLN